MGRGGYRPGSGPQPGTKYRPRAKKAASGRDKGTPKKPKNGPRVPRDITAEAKAENLDPLTYMLKVMNDPEVTDATRKDRMAIAAAPFCHARKGEGAGKKEDKADRAKNAAAGKFAAGKPPLKVVK